MKSWIIGCSLLSVLLMLMLVFKESWNSPAQIWVFAGKFHPLFLHLPIGMLVIVVLMEALAKLKDRKSHATMPLLMTTLASVAAVIFGYILMRTNTYPEDAIDSHLWSGVIFTVVLIWALFFKLRFNETGRGQKTYRVLLILSTVLMFAAGHYGGVITHGDPLDEAPWLKKPAETVSVSIDDRLVYEQILIPILEQKCYKCHGKKKKKGHLRMDSYAAMLEGGNEGPCVVPGDPKKSLLVEYIRLPLDDEYRMPPEDKPQLTAEETELIEWWVKMGAPQQKKLSELDVPSDIRLALESISGQSMQVADVAHATGKLEVSPEVKASQVQANYASAVKKLQKQYPGALTWVSRSDAKLSLNTVGMRENFKDADLANFKGLSPLIQAADFTAAGLTDASGPLLAAMTSLQSLRLSETQITDEALSSIASIKSLESLSLYGVKVTDNGVLSLSTLTGLKHIYLWRTEVTPDGQKALQLKLPTCEVHLGSKS